MYFGVFFENYLINPEKENGFTQPWAEYDPQASIVADRWPNPVGLARRARLRRGHRAPCGRGGMGDKGSPAVELWQGGWRRHWCVTGNPLGKGAVAGVHQ
jgi:hypothetical protein